MRRKSLGGRDGDKLTWRWGNSAECTPSTKTSTATMTVPVAFGGRAGRAIMRRKGGASVR